jgi:hypothetical protein
MAAFQTLLGLGAKRDRLDVVGTPRGRLLAAIGDRRSESAEPRVPGSRYSASMTGQWEPVPFAHNTDGAS